MKFEKSLNGEIMKLIADYPSGELAMQDSIACSGTMQLISERSKLTVQQRKEAKITSIFVARRYPDMNCYDTKSSLVARKVRSGQVGVRTLPGGSAAVDKEKSQGLDELVVADLELATDSFVTLGQYDHFKCIVDSNIDRAVGMNFQDNI